MVLVAITRKMPVVWPAVYRPVAVIVPPVAVNVALTGATELSLYLPDTENCFVWPTYTVVGPVMEFTEFRFCEMIFSTYSSRGVGVLTEPTLSPVTVM